MVSSLVKKMVVVPSLILIEVDHPSDLVEVPYSVEVDPSAVVPCFVDPFDREVDQEDPFESHEELTSVEEHPFDLAEASFVEEDPSFEMVDRCNFSAVLVALARRILNSWDLVEEEVEVASFDLVSSEPVVLVETSSEVAAVNRLEDSSVPSLDEVEVVVAAADRPA